MADEPVKSFLRPGKLILLIFLGLLVYAGAVVATVPAGWVWYWAEKQFALPDAVRVEGVTGQLWDGGAQLRLMNRSVQVFWHLEELGTGPGWATLGWRLKSRSSELRGDFTVLGENSAQLEMTGNVHVPEFHGQIRRSGGAMINGDVTIQRLTLRMARNQVVAANGLATWPGGPVRWPVGQRMQSAEIPAMEMRLADQNGTPMLTLTESGKQVPVADASIQANGNARIRVYRRMVDLVDQPWSGNQGPGAVIFQVTQPLMMGAG